jgi:hypothetical protein
MLSPARGRGIKGEGGEGAVGTRAGSPLRWEARIGSRLSASSSRALDADLAHKYDPR